MEDGQELRDLVAAPLLDAVYVETKELKQVVAIQPKPGLGSESVRESVLKSRRRSLRFAP